MSSKNAYFYLAYFGFGSTVTESQVLTPIQKLRNEGFLIHLLLFEGPLRWHHTRHKLKHRIGAPPFSILIRMPRNILFINTLFLLIKLIPPLLKSQKIIFHVRGPQGVAVLSPLMKFFKKIKLIYDDRGLVAEEYQYAIHKTKNRELNFLEKAWKSHLQTLTRSALKKAHVVFSVSKWMRQYHLKQLPGLDKKPFQYVPCAVDVELYKEAISRRDQWRKSLGFDQKIVVVFSGGAHVWHCPHQIANLFKSLKNLNSKCFFLGLTPAPDKLKLIFKKEGVTDEDFQMRQVPFQDIPNYLVACDIGVLLREDDPTNYAACPTKFGEYLASGLHVLTTSAVKDIADIVQDTTVGHVIALQNIPQSVLKAILEQAQNIEQRIERSQSVAQTMFDWAQYIPAIRKWYSSVE